jgi:exonuclease III
MSFAITPMNSDHYKSNWTILSWNVRGINSEQRWEAIRGKVIEAKCDILCLQETKRASFDEHYIRKFCPRSLDDFAFLPSTGNSGGSLIVWNSSKFFGHLSFQNEYAQSVEFTCKLSGEVWILTNVYAPCTSEGKMAFLNWFKHIEMPDEVKWLIVGDFNLIRSQENRNKPGGNIQEMLAFNDAISNLRLVELPLKGCKYTWTNKQHNPLLERLDWFFSSNARTTFLPNSFATGLVRDGSDHTPCAITASTSVPRPLIFRFENYWLEHEEFLNVLQQGWDMGVQHPYSAKRISAKFKNLRKVFKEWKRKLPNLASAIRNSRDVIQFLDILEEFRDLTLDEWNLRNIISSHLQCLLHQQKLYWKQRGTINWVKFGDECTSFFHANASMRHRGNNITSLRKDSGQEVFQHEAKAELIWETFKGRMGSSEFSHMYFDLQSLLHMDTDLCVLEEPFSKEEIDAVINDLPSNKSPGPNGFNGDFLKKCWSLIAQDFYTLCQDFFNNNVCLQSINSSFITLVPKKDNLLALGDYGPISLLNSSIKLLTKILAVRLQKVILRLIHKNQYGFIKSRSIHDCLAWAFEHLHICKTSKKELVIIKLDFEKAFDRIEHRAILDILKFKGFGDRWQGWIKRF